MNACWPQEARTLNLYSSTVLKHRYKSKGCLELTQSVYDKAKERVPITTNSKPKILEKEIENNILRYLGSINIFAWKTKTVGTFDQRLGKFRKSSPMYKKGVADIVGILPDGKLLAIEVKSQKGRLSPEQKIFLSEITSRGGVAFVARSVEDVEAEFLSRGIHARDLVTSVTG